MLPAAALLDALFSNAPVGLAAWDRELRFDRVSPELAAMNGVPVAAHLGRRPGEVLPELGLRVEEMLRAVLDSGEPLLEVDVAGETPSAPGVRRHWLSSYFPVSDANGDTAGVTGVIVEVTGERQASLRAAAATERSESVDAELGALYSALPVGVAFLDTELRYRRVNQTLAQMNGREVAEHTGASLEDILGARAAQLSDALTIVLETREPLNVELSAPLPHDPDTMRAVEATYFPVEVDGRLLGVGGVVQDVTKRQEIETEQSRLLREALLSRAKAEAAEVRADNAREDAERARSQAERTREQFAFLATAGREMARSMDWESTAQALVRSAVPVIADQCALTVVEPRGRLRTLAVAPSGPAGESRDGDLATAAANVIRTGTTQESAETVIVPLKTPAGVIGALSFAQVSSGRRFTADDLDLIMSLAARAALHIHNARLYTERSHIARTLQASLRPRALPVVPGVDVAARFLPAGDHNEVGGDFYDVFLSGDGVWTAIVGDVSGKGAEAAAVTALARHTLRTASMLDDDPAANLALLNRALHVDPEALQFCTVFYARMTPSDDGVDLRFANGGHPAPLLLRPDGRVERIDTGRGPLVGAFPDARFTEASAHLAPGELLLMYTDGVTEVRTTDADLGEHELHQTLASLAGASADEVVAAVERRAVEVQDGAPRDDIALVAVRAHSS